MIEHTWLSVEYIRTTLAKLTLEEKEQNEIFSLEKGRIELNLRWLKIFFTLVANLSLQTILTVTSYPAAHKSEAVGAFMNVFDR